MALNKRTKTGINVVFAVAICFAILLMLNFIAFRHYKRFDISKSKFYSISDKTKNILSSLKNDLNVYVFFQPNNAMYARVKRLLDVYSGQSKKIKVEYVDPARDIARTKMLAEKYKIERADIVIFEYNKNVKYVYKNEIAEYDYSGVYYGKPPVFKAFKGEAGFSSAILSITGDVQQKVYFTTGHGEKDIGKGGKDGVIQAVQILKENNYKIEKINLIGKESLEKTVKILIICGPVKPFMENEINLIRKFVNDGNKLFVMIDPLQFCGLENLLTEFGIIVGNNVVVDPARKLPFVSPANLFIAEYGKHEITSSMENISTLYPLARSVTKAKDTGKYVVTELTKTSKDAWGELDFNSSPFKFEQGKDLDGPVSIAVAAFLKEDKKGSKIVVIGDSDFISNTQISSLGNADFFANIVNWFAEKKELLAISPKIPDRVSLILSASQMSLVFWLFVLGIPGLWIIAGVLVFINRRK